MEWNLIAATTINAVFVLIAVQFLKVHGIPWLKQEAPWVLPLITLVIGPLMQMLTNYLVGLLGQPIDLSPIVGLFTGGTAVALHQIYKQSNKKTVKKAGKKV